MKSEGLDENEMVEYIKKHHMLKCPQCGHEFSNEIDRHAIQALISYAISEDMTEVIDKVLTKELFKNEKK